MRAIVLQSTALLVALAVSGAAAPEPGPPAAAADLAAVAAPAADAAVATAPAVDAVATVPPYDATGRRDPFRPFMLDLKADPPPHVTPLQRYELGQLTVVGTVWEVSPPRGMVEDSMGMGYIVSVGTPIGRNGGVVTAIEPRQVVVEERVLDFYGNEQVRRIVMETPKEGSSNQVARGPK